MAPLIVDTSALYALVDRHDPNHLRAEAFLRERKTPGGLIVSNHVFDETMTLSKSRLGMKVALELGLRLRYSRLVEMVIFSKAEEQEVWRVFSQHSDKPWSYTNCASLVLARRYDIKEAFAFDRHFAQMGLVMRP